jgi:hypothetical protein
MRTSAECSGGQYSSTFRMQPSYWTLCELKTCHTSSHRTRSAPGFSSTSVTCTGPILETLPTPESVCSSLTLTDSTEHWNDTSGTSSRLGTAGKLQSSNLKWRITITTTVYYSNVKATSAWSQGKQCSLLTDWIYYRCQSRWFMYVLKISI